MQAPRPLSAFEQWALANLPEDLRRPQDELFDDGISNLERFAFGLNATDPVMDFQPLQSADPPTEQIAGVDYGVYSYMINEAALEAGLNITPQVSRDDVLWENIVNITDPDYETLGPILCREGDVVTFKYPLWDSADTYSFRIAISDTYEGMGDH